MVTSIQLEDTSTAKEKYYLVTSKGTIFHQIPFEEIDNLTREVWVSRCPNCADVIAYSYSKKEAKEANDFCFYCNTFHQFDKRHRYRGCIKQKVDFKLLTSGYKIINGIKYPYVKMK